MSSAKKLETWPIIRRMIRDYLMKYRVQFGWAILFMAISAALTAAFALMIEPIIDDVLTKGRLEYVWMIGLGVFVLFVLRGVTTYAHTVIMNFAGQRVIGDIQRDLFSHFISLDLKFFHDHPSGQLISRIVNDVSVMRNTAADGMTGLGKSLLTLIFLVGVMFHQDVVLASAIFVIFPLAVVFVMWIGRRLRKMSGRIQDHMASLSDMLSQIFLGVRVVKAYGREGYEINRATQAIDRVRDMVIKSVRIGNLSTPFNEVLVGTVVCGVLVYGGYQVAAGETTAGQLLSFITAFSLAYEPIRKLARMNNSIQVGLGACDRVFGLLDIPPDISDLPDAKAVTFKKPDIVFSRVTFQYHSDEKKALNDVSFTLKGGEMTALVGRSGSGKTTIMNLIPRFFDPVSGSILIDGQDVRHIQIESLRQNMALVSQDITIFDDTVWANIGYGLNGATQDDIIKAAIAAEADEFIRALPQGYDTRLGEEGLKLSGGQKQRISIARAILRDAPILLLDEATSALDNEAERAIQKTLSELQKGRTTLVIAHRLSTVQDADHILVLEEGRVAEQGRHHQLLDQNGIYARIYGAGLSE
ncbi:MAG: ABC transporter ATP-binding protein [Alphaproteobacteria bacterium]|nr:ABC transporter ATP-binding protein [Alphaproteobacteria bacterium]